MRAGRRTTRGERWRASEGGWLSRGIRFLVGPLDQGREEREREREKEKEGHGGKVRKRKERTETEIMTTAKGIKKLRNVKH